MDEGYARIAKFMGRHDDYAIYRRFRHLNTQNLLYLQAELVHLERQLSSLAKRDMLHPDRLYFTKDWWSLSQNEGDEDSEQWEKVLEIREKLDEYNIALLQQAKIANLEPPSSYDLAFLRQWFIRPQMGDYPLLGLDRKAYDPEYEHDLVALKARSTPDFFSRWLTYYLIPKWHNSVGRKIKDPEKQEIGESIYEYKDNILVIIIRVATTVVASLLPVCSVIALYFIGNNTMRLGVVVVASAFLALALSLMTNARKVEVFAATAAYAAVNVVFLTNTIEVTI